MTTTVKTATVLLCWGIGTAWAQSVGIPGEEQSTQIGNSVLIDIGEATGGRLPKNSFIELKTQNQKNKQMPQPSEQTIQISVSKKNGAEYLHATVDGHDIPTEKLTITVRDQQQRETWGLSVDPTSGRIRKARPGDYSIEVQFKNKVEVIPFKAHDQKKE